MQNCKYYCCYCYFYVCPALKCIVENMMSVLQVVKGLYTSILLSIRKTSFHTKVQAHCACGLPVLT